MLRMALKRGDGTVDRGMGEGRRDECSNLGCLLLGVLGNALFISCLAHVWHDTPEVVIFEVLLLNLQN